MHLERRIFPPCHFGQTSEGACAPEPRSPSGVTTERNSCDPERNYTLCSCYRLSYRGCNPGKWVPVATTGRNPLCCRSGGAALVGDAGRALVPRSLSNLDHLVSWASDRSY